MTKNILSILVLALGVITTCQSADTDWRPVTLENAVLMTLPQGKVVIELAPQFSPAHVAQFKQLVKQGYYDGESFYRVIDGFVAQAGPKDGSVKDKSVATLAIEDEWNTDEHWSFTLAQKNDLFAPATGFKQGFAVGYSPQENKAWFTHCPGVIAMARESAPNTASSHFYIVNGQAPRYLDRIMTIFGRVVYGMQHVQSVTRTSVIEGETEIDSAAYTSIVSMKIMADVKPIDRVLVEVESTESSAFHDKLVKRKQRAADFFYKKPPPVLDVCQIPVVSRLIKGA